MGEEVLGHQGVARPSQGPHRGRKVPLYALEERNLEEPSEVHLVGFLAQRHLRGNHHWRAQALPARIEEQADLPLLQH